VKKLTSKDQIRHKVRELVGAPRTIVDDLCAIRTLQLVDALHDEPEGFGSPERIAVGLYRASR
jgi:hypothetical protein